MKLTRNAKLALLVVAVVATAAVGYTLYGGDQALAGTVCVSTGEVCPHAGSECEGCPHAAPAVGQSGAETTVEAGAAPRVDPSKCIGCTKCVRVAPDAYTMNPDTNKAEIRPGAPAASVEKGAKACPAGAVIR